MITFKFGIQTNKSTYRLVLNPNRALEEIEIGKYKFHTDQNWFLTLKCVFFRNRARPVISKQCGNMDHPIIYIKGTFFCKQKKRKK